MNMQLKKQSNSLQTNFKNYNNKKKKPKEGETSSIQQSSVTKPHTNTLD